MGPWRFSLCKGMIQGCAVGFQPVMGRRRNISGIRRGEFPTRRLADIGSLHLFSFEMGSPWHFAERTFFVPLPPSYRIRSYPTQ
jgi:hypothetical protein